MFMVISCVRMRRPSRTAGRRVPACRSHWAGAA